MLQIHTVDDAPERAQARLAHDLVAPVDRVAGLALVVALAVVAVVAVVVLFSPSSSTFFSNPSSFAGPVVGVALAPPPIRVLAAALGRPPPRVRLAARPVAAVALGPPRAVVAPRIFPSRIVAAAAALVVAPRVLAPRPALVVAAAPRLVLSPAVVAPRPAVIDSTAVFAA